MKSHQLLSIQKLNNFFEYLIPAVDKVGLNQSEPDVIDPLRSQKIKIADQFIAKLDQTVTDPLDARVLNSMQSFLLEKKATLSPEVFKQASNLIMCEPGQILKHQDLNNFVESLVGKDFRSKNLIEKELASILKENIDLIDFSSSEQSISIGSISQAALMLKFLEKLEQQSDSSILKTIIKSDKISEGEDFIFSVLDRNIKKASSKNYPIDDDKEALNFTEVVSILNTELNPNSTLKPGALLQTNNNQPSSDLPSISKIAFLALGLVTGLASLTPASAAPIIRGNGLAPSFPLKTPLFSPKDRRGQADDDCDPNVKSAQQNCPDPNSPSPPPAPPPPAPPPPAPPPPAPPPPAPPPSSTTTVAAPPPPPPAPPSPPAPTNSSSLAETGADFNHYYNDSLRGTSSVAAPPPPPSSTTIVAAPPPPPPAPALTNSSSNAETVVDFGKSYNASSLGASSPSPAPTPVVAPTPPPQKNYSYVYTTAPFSTSNSKSSENSVEGSTSAPSTTPEPDAPKSSAAKSDDLNLALGLGLGLGLPAAAAVAYCAYVYCCKRKPQQIELRSPHNVITGVALSGNLVVNRRSLVGPQP
jgi:hypothetical protein